MRARATLTRMKLLAPLIAAVLLLAGCGDDSKSYLDANTLETHLRKAADARIADEPDRYGTGTHVTSLKCVEGEPRIFECVGETSDGQRDTATVTVSKDGSEYVSDTH